MTTYELRMTDGSIVEVQADRYLAPWEIDHQPYWRFYRDEEREPTALQRLLGLDPGHDGREVARFCEGDVVWVNQK